MSWGYVAVAGATLVAGYMGSEAQKDAAKDARQGGEAGIAEQRYQFDQLQEMLAPYREGGEEALAAQRALIGLAGPEAQEEAIMQLEQSPAFTAAMEQGEEAILQNAAATGGLRGGNIQRALGQFRPQLLADTIQRQYANLGGITNLGQSSAAMTGSAGMQTGANISNIYGDIAANTAASRLGRAQTYGDTAGNLAGLFLAYQNRPQQTGGTTTSTGGKF